MMTFARHTSLDIVKPVRWLVILMQCTAHSHLIANTYYNPGSGTLIPECNGLSQFREDTGEPSIPV